MSYTVKSASKLQWPVLRVLDAVQGIRKLVQTQFKEPDPTYFGALTESELQDMERKAVVVKRVNATVTLLSVLPLLLLCGFRVLMGKDLAADPSLTAMPVDLWLSACFAVIPAVMILQLLAPLDGGQLILQKLMPARRAEGPRQTYNCPLAHAYRDAVRRSRQLRVVDIECMRRLQEAYEVAHTSDSTHPALA